GARLAGSAVRSGARSRRPTELALHRDRAPQSFVVAPRRGCARRADLGARVWRPAPRGRTAGVRGAQLAARGAGRGFRGLRTTAAAVGQVGVVRRDPMAMQPFCGYNFGDYWQHWLEVGARLAQAPRIYHVNWFRRDAQGKFLWPGYGENLRVLAWMLDRCAGKAAATEAAIGWLPRPEDLNVDGLGVGRDALAALLSVDPALWRKEVAEIREYLARYGSRLPAA